MEVFPPTSTIKRDEFRDEITGEINLEYILIPRMEGQFRISPITLTFFDTSAGRFITIRSKTTDIIVTPGSASESIVSNFSRENVKILGEDIRFINTKNPKWYKRGNHLDMGSLFFFFFNVHISFSISWSKAPKNINS